MGLWDVVKGHDDFMSEIRNTSDPEIVVFKHPNEDFNTKSHLYLNPSEVALFVNTKADGSSETFLIDQGGTLDTNNLPFFRSITRIFTGGQTMFHCAVFFIRTNIFVTNNWGTEAPVGPLEDSRHYTFKLVANGSYDLHITDPKMLLDNILGYGVSSVTQSDMAMKLNPKISNFVATLLSGVFEKPELKASLPRIQKAIRNEARETFGRLMNEEYTSKWGTEFSDFTMNLEDVYDNLAEQYLENNRMIQKTEAFDYQGEAYSTIQLYEMLKSAAENPGSMASSMMGMGVGAGVGVGIGNSIASTIGTTILDRAIGGTSPVGGTKTDPDAKERTWGGLSENDKKRMNRQSRLEELKDYYDRELIDKETYDRKVKEIIDEISHHII